MGIKESLGVYSLPPDGALEGIFIAWSINYVKIQVISSSHQAIHVVVCAKHSEPWVLIIAWFVTPCGTTLPRLIDVMI